MANRAKGKPPAAATRRAKAAPGPFSAQQQTPLFCLHHADRASPNVWAFKPSGEDAPGLFSFLCEMAQLKWAEIESHKTGGGASRHRKHHDQPIDSIDAEAQEDLRRKRLDEEFGDTIFRFRLSGEGRLWGFRSGRTFHVVWWDPDHKVYSTEAN